MAEGVIHVVGAAVLRDGRCLVAQRGEGMSLAGRWEFPGGKVEAGEAPEAALVREVREELGVEIRVGEHLGRGEGAAGAARVVLDVYAATLVSGHVHPREHAAVRWVGPAELEGLAWPEADLPVLPAVRRRLTGEARA